MRTFVYIDGFNLYFRLLRDRPQFKWLDVVRLCRDVLSTKNVVSKVNYYTARVSGRLDAGAPARQHAYLEALKSLPEISIHYGNFLIAEKWAGLVHPPETRPTVVFPQPWPSVVKVVKTEEKGSDVNLASHLVRDAYLDAFDVAAVLSNDTDLVEPIRIVVQQVKKPVGLISPVPKPATGLLRAVQFVRHIRDHHLRRAQLPTQIPGTRLVRPAAW